MVSPATGPSSPDKLATILPSSTSAVKLKVALFTVTLTESSSAK